jgi:hypothetical protein
VKTTTLRTRDVAEALEVRTQTVRRLAESTQVEWRRAAAPGARKLLGVLGHDDLDMIRQRVA